MTVLNPFGRVDEHIMDDADLYGPLIFCFCFATVLLFVSTPLGSNFIHAMQGMLETRCPIVRDSVRDYKMLSLRQPWRPLQSSEFRLKALFS